MPRSPEMSQSRARRSAAAGILSALLAVSLSSCGYRLQGAAGPLFTAPETRVDLRPFRNDSVFADVGAVLADRVREEMLRTGFRGRFERARADILVDGHVRDVKEDVWSLGTEKFALEHRLTLVIDIRIVDVSRGRLLWKEESVSETASYFAGTDFQFTEANRRVALEEVCRRMARRIAQNLRVVL